MKRFIYVILLCCFALSTKFYAQENVISTKSELINLRRIEGLPQYLEKTEIRQVSSYDTTGGNDDGFSGKYSFVKRNVDSSLVIFQEEGKGVINRIWTPTPTEDTLDFYLGNSKDPTFSIKFSDLFSGKVYPFVQPLSGNEIGGYYNYFPIAFNKGCKIVFRGKKLEFYQIQYRKYPKDYKVDNFSPNLTTSEREELEKLKNDWQNIDLNKADIKINIDTILKPGETVTLAEFNKGGRILGFTFENAEDFEGLNKQIDIRITWDDEKTPSIYMPIADYFGYAFGKVSMQSLLIGSKNNINYSYFPMPFDKNAKVELIYRPSDNSKVDSPIQINANFFASNNKRQKMEEGKFYAFWNKDRNAKLGEPHVFLKGEGHGHYIGTILQAQGLNPGMTLFFEGDDVTNIDGEMRLHGTGSEDYFNGGWYALLDRWDRKISLPLHGSLDYSLPFSRTGGYRLFISDKMPFNKEIYHSIEHGPENNNVAVDYTSVAFYYADAPVGKGQENPINALTSTYIPKTFVLYPQLMEYSFAGKVNVDRDILTSTTGGQVRIDLTKIPKGDYKLYADIEKSPDGTEISIWQRQKNVAETVSFYSDERELEDDKFLCDIVLNEFKETITIKFKEADNRSKINIRRLILVRE